MSSGRSSQLDNKEPHEKLETQPQRMKRSTVNQTLKKHSKAVVKSYKIVLSIRFLMMVVLVAFNIGFGYYSALLYFASNAIDLGVSKTDAAFLLSVFGIAGTIGRATHGQIVDKKLLTLFQLSSLVMGVSGITCIIGSFAKSYGALMAFAIVLGLSTNIGNNMFPVLLREVVGINHVKKVFGVTVHYLERCWYNCSPFTR